MLPDGQDCTISCAPSHLSFRTILEHTIFYYPVLQIRKRKPREVQRFAQRHTARKSHQGVPSHTKGRGKHAEWIFLGRMSPAGQGYPKPFLPMQGYESLCALSLRSQTLNYKVHTLLQISLQGSLHRPANYPVP